MNYKIKELFTSRYYPIIFSILYASVLVLIFYPGVLYSDSHVRWQTAKYFSDFGFFNDYYPFNDHHPIVPSMIMSLFYSLTGEIGFFIFIQALLFSHSVFRLSDSINKDYISRIAISLLLIVPINSLYAIFHSFDTLFALIFVYIICELISLSKTHKLNTLKLSFLLFLAIALRLNSIVLIPLVLIFIILNLKREKLLKKNIFILIISISSLLPILITSALPIQKGNGWVVGLCFEYSNMVCHSKDPKQMDFLKKIDVDINKLKRYKSYTTEYKSTSHILMSKIKYNNELSKELFYHYIKLAYKEPLMFFKEKLKYTYSLFGVTNKIRNSEIGKWRETFFNTPNYWLYIFEDEYGFESTESKEKFVDRYFWFSKYFPFIFRPYMMFLFAFIISLGVKRYLQNNISVNTIDLCIYTSLLYYCTFILNCPQHQFRYFFPAFVILEVIILISSLPLIKHFFKIYYKKLYLETSKT